MKLALFILVIVGCAPPNEIKVSCDPSVLDRAFTSCASELGKCLKEMTEAKGQEQYYRNKWLSAPSCGE